MTKATGAAPRRGLRGVSRSMSRSWQLYLLVLPALVYIAVFKYWPMYGVQIAFKAFNAGKGIAGSPWVGLK
nr:sugar ABC transporter permease [Clostridia bacterium]